MAHYNRNRREETKAELEFSESERVYGRSTYINRPSSYYQGSINEGDSDVIYSRNNGSRYRDGGRSYVRGGSSFRTTKEKERTQQTRGGAPGIYSKEGLRETNMRTYGNEGSTYYHRRNFGKDRTYHRGNNLSSNYYRDTHAPSEKYYVRETIREEPEKEKPETEEVIICCCGCVEVVDSIYCKGMKMYRCHCSGDEKEDKQQLTKTNTMSYRRQRDESFRGQQQQQRQYLMYRRRDHYNSDDETESVDSETDHTYDEIPTRTKEMLTYEKPQTTKVYNRTDATINRNAAVISRPRSGEQHTKTYDIRQRNIHSAPPAKRHVGVQMTTKYIVQEQQSQKKLVRNVNTQTVVFQQEVLPPSRQTQKLSLTKKEVVTHSSSPTKKEVVTHSSSPPSPPIQPPPPKPIYIGDKPKIQHYKTAVIDIGEQKVEEDVIVVPTDPPKTVIEVPKEPEPEPEIIWIHEYKPEPEVIMEPIYDPLPVEPLPLPIKVEPIKDIKFIEPVTQEEPRKEMKPEQAVIKRVTLDPIKEEKPKKEKAVIRVFAKGTTALFHLLPKPKRKSIMVRVGGGWMKVEHHRNHHVPLTVQEHHREANKDKYLYIKSKFVTNQKQVPVAYKKYREEIIKQGA